MLRYVDITTLRKIIIVLASITIIAGCAHFEKQSNLSVVTDRLPGYLRSDMVPNSKALLPPPPAAGSTALALDHDISRNSLTLRDSPRWALAAEDADLMFPKAAGTFSCALNAPVTEQGTPHLYVLLRRVLSDVGLATSRAKNRYMRTRPFVENKERTCSPNDEQFPDEERLLPFGA